MGIFNIILILATLLCSLVAGFLLAFAVVVMPGIKSLNDREFIRAFQVMDRIIQNNNPIFMLIWAGSILALTVCTVMGLMQLDGSDRIFLVCTLPAYVLGVQLPTIAVNLPLNNRLQALDVDQMDNAARKDARRAFEPGWNRSNNLRTTVACLVSIALMIILFSM